MGHIRCFPCPCLLKLIYIYFDLGVDNNINMNYTVIESSGMTRTNLENEMFQNIKTTVAALNHKADPNKSIECSILRSIQDEEDGIELNIGRWIEKGKTNWVSIENALNHEQSIDKRVLHTFGTFREMSEFISAHNGCGKSWCNSDGTFSVYTY